MHEILTFCYLHCIVTCVYLLNTLYILMGTGRNAGKAEMHKISDFSYFHYKVTHEYLLIILHLCDILMGTSRGTGRAEFGF